MKKYLSIFVLAGVLMLAGCGAKSGGQSQANYIPTPVPTQVPTVVTTVDIKGTKDGVSAFLTQLDKIRVNGMIDGMTITNDNFFNVTDPEVKAKAGCSIFRQSDTGAAFVLIDNKVYPIGQYFGGDGLLSNKLSDFDKDGKYEIIYSYNFTSGKNRSQIAVFSLKNKKETVLDIDYTTRDLILAKATNDKFTIYSAQVKESNPKAGWFKLDVLSGVANLTYTNDAYDIQYLLS